MKNENDVNKHYVLVHKDPEFDQLKEEIKPLLYESAIVDFDVPL